MKKSKKIFAVDNSVTLVCLQEQKIRYCFHDYP